VLTTNMERRTDEPGDSNILPPHPKKMFAEGYNKVCMRLLT